ncbi:hypothetical protein W97_08765 [Coniosporium apollinis CBS 100218]|uniref:Uncharacterized protein n=1 Tax=Coniosporium apollinis (strain CBS 100218) TaxID=1168221 RepID=R7Z5P4_CONA1|nr:uncharacterized protein W97_08765 [Coniosporium apollinis CBS 100218]EON69505.1 hypothetical protein W97_08765 [Coniosporium apollinis CBS 100218]
MATSNNTIPLAETEFAEMRSVIFSPEAYTICPRCERDCTDTRINRVCVACERRFNEEMSRTKGGEKTRRYWRRMLKEAQEQQIRYRGLNEIAVEPAEEAEEAQNGPKAAAEEPVMVVEEEDSWLVKKLRALWKKLKG